MGRNEPHSTRTRAPGELELEPVASTKLSPPRGARLMPRDALLARMLEARRKRCLVLQGPAGCGKTSMLVSWRQALMGLDFDIAWLSLSAEDNELGRFFDCLLASLAQVDPAIVREVAYLVGHGSDASAVEHWVIKLVQGVSSRARELVLIVDDLHHVDDPRVAPGAAMAARLRAAQPAPGHRFACRGAVRDGAAARAGPAGRVRPARPSIHPGGVRALPAREAGVHRHERRPLAA